MLPYCVAGVVDTSAEHFRRPPGSAPKDCDWNVTRGVWINRVTGEARSAGSAMRVQKSVGPQQLRPAGPAPADCDWNVAHGMWINRVTGAERPSGSREHNQQRSSNRSDEYRAAERERTPTGTALPSSRQRIVRRCVRVGYASTCDSDVVYRFKLRMDEGTPVRLHAKILS